MKETVRHSRPLLRTAALAVALAAGLLAGCGGGSDTVARLEVEPAHLDLPYGTFADVRFRWTPSAELKEAEGAPRVFVHLLDEDGDLVRTFDHDLAGTWRVGEPMEYDARVYQSLLAPPLLPGTYSLTAGLYDPASGARWPLATDGEDVARNEYQVATFEVPSSTGEEAGVPAVLFGPAWSPTLAGADRQVIAYRWLSGDGTIRLERLREAGTLWLSLSIPPEREGNLVRRIVDAPEGGDGVPHVDLTVSCSGFESEISGDGTHGVEIPLEPSEGACDVSIAPNFVLESPSHERRTVVLEVLAWRPGSAS